MSGFKIKRAYRCSTDHGYHRCPGHFMELEYHGCADTYSIKWSEEDEPRFLDPKQIKTFAEIIDSMRASGDLEDVKKASEQDESGGLHQG